MALWHGVVRRSEDEREKERRGLGIWGVVVLRMRCLVYFGARAIA